ncbi:MAG TPA: hypothetical protein VFL86_00320 [Burkholderiaceae bacterium]|nr:hypothetical protein [Burkholderiaceae bacterium]
MASSIGTKCKRVAVAMGLWHALCPGLAPSARADEILLPHLGSRATPDDGARPDQVPDDATLEAAGARIGTVRIDRQNEFDLSRPEEDTTLFRIADWLHIRTREQTVATQLLFKPGDPYDARLLQESERLLRSNSFLRDARIRPVAWHDGVVDVDVVTQDLWTLNPGISIGRSGGSGSTGMGISELNLLGLGSELSVSVKSNVDRSTRTMSYRDRQLAGSWWGVAAQYSNNSDGRSQELALDHPFYALDSRWAAGAMTRSVQRVESQYELGQVIGQFRVDQKSSTVYAGRSEGLVNGWVTRWTAGLTRDEHRVDPLAMPVPLFAAPGWAGTPPTQRQLTFPWLGIELLEDAFVKTRNQDQIGRTEDFQLGWQAQARVGVATPGFGSDRDAVVFDARVSRAMQDTPAQTLEVAASASGRVESGRLEGAMFSASGRYYFRHSPQAASFLSLAVDHGVRLEADQQLLLGGDNGLRGYPMRYQSGSGRWLFTAERRAFSDWYPWRLFNVGGAVFFDMGRTWGSMGSPDASGTAAQGVLRDLGFGLRLGNSRSALGSVVHIDLAFPFDGDASIRKVQFLIETRRSF